MPISRARKTDWDQIYDLAKSGQMDDIPRDIYIRHYSTLKRIRVDHCTPSFRDNIQVVVYYGPTGTGKTHRAWREAMITGDPYIKNPNTKWWDGYRGQQNVIIDEFAGRIDISYLLTWLDRYPLICEIKGYSMPLEAIRFWITSNLHPTEWYPEAKPNHLDALLRRCCRGTARCELLDEPYVAPPEEEVVDLPELFDLSQELDNILNLNYWRTNINIVNNCFNMRTICSNSTKKL